MTCRIIVTNGHYGTCAELAPQKPARIWAPLRCEFSYPLANSVLTKSKNDDASIFSAPPVEKRQTPRERSAPGIIQDALAASLPSVG